MCFGVMIDRLLLLFIILGRSQDIIGSLFLADNDKVYCQSKLLKYTSWWCLLRRDLEGNELVRFFSWQHSYVVQYVFLLNAKKKESKIYSGYSMSKTSKSINSLRKCLWKKVRSEITRTFFNRFWSWKRCHVMQYVLLLIAKVKKVPINYQKSIVDTTWTSLENLSILSEDAYKKSLGNNSYIF